MNIGSTEVLRLHAKQAIGATFSTKRGYASMVLAAFLALSFVGVLTLSVFSLMRVSVYAREVEGQYFNALYLLDDNISKVRMHVFFGVVTVVVLVPLTLIGAFFYRTMFLACFVLLLGSTIGTVVTVLPMGSFTKLGDIAGTGVLSVAGIWAVLWITATIVCIVAACGCCKSRHGSFGIFRWLVRSSGLAAFGFLLLPTLFALKDQKAADTVVHIAMLLWMIGLGEYGARVLVPSNSGPIGKVDDAPA